MIGSIIGDITGSIYEFNNIKTKDFELFQDDMTYTDDTILSIATADWILNGGDPGKYYFDYAKKYPHPMGAYGSSFSMWVMRYMNGSTAPYNSCGNGSAMRVGPVGWAATSMGMALSMAKNSAEVTHNHPQGIMGAQATALATFMARLGHSKEDIRNEMEEWFNYNLDFTCDEIRPTYDWEDTCQNSVPQAIVCVLDAEDFEDAIRNAISIGGDSDTLGCIAGGIAEAMFGVPMDMRKKAEEILPPELLNIVYKFEDQYGCNNI